MTSPRRRVNPNKQVLPVVPVPPDGIVTVGANSVITRTLLGWTFTHHETNAAITAGVKTLLSDTSHTLNQHMQAFGTSHMQASAGAAISWTSLDQRFGYAAGAAVGDYSGQNNGWMSAMPPGECTITLLGCPAWMRVDPAGTYTQGANNDPKSSGYNAWKLGVPSAAELEQSASEFQPPWIGHFQAFADLAVTTLQRFPHIKYVQVWNELKDFYSNSAGRWDWETYTRLYNVCWTTIKAAVTAGTVRSDIKIGGPYPVFSSYEWDQTSKKALNTRTDVTDRLEGTWGAGDMTVMAAVKGWARNANGADYLMLDVRNNNKDYERYDYYEQITDGRSYGTGRITSVAARFLPDHANGWASDKNYISGTGIPAGAYIGTYVSPTEVTVVSSSGGAVSIPAATNLQIRWGGSLTKLWPHTNESYRWPVNPWASVAKKRAIRTWVNSLATFTGTTPEGFTKANYDGTSNSFDIRTLPIWWSEWYANPRTELKLVSTDTLPVAANQELLSVEVWNFIDDIIERDGGIIKWKTIGGEHNQSDRADPMALYDKNTLAATILHPAMKFLKDNFANGKQLKATTSDHADIYAIATATHIMAVSKSATALTIQVDGVNRSFDPYGVQMIVR